MQKIKILLMLFCLCSFIFVWNPHCFYDGYFCAAEEKRSSLVSKKLREKRKKINEMKRRNNMFGSNAEDTSFRNMKNLRILFCGILFRQGTQL
ncbi:hypothetical protein ATZ36_09850 [Candidatus Endomicrobiellum trichonymphae]|uniref:Uncharacterized protein n=1 Tax=Endomicrobium trichonymphae TaxID=1408204 RepID=A0A1E5IHA1_ENDTX|nr:hypothetical protein ATZ36_09850 [Candidatus Endomicrobium trichonymphae]